MTVQQAVCGLGYTVTCERDRQLGNLSGRNGGLTCTVIIRFFNSHFWNPEVLNFTNFFVPRANSCPMGLLSGHLGSHIEFP